ncbi:MAG: hypothetical protein AAB069_01230 [Planctomycetota bacterium]
MKGKTWVDWAAKKLIANKTISVTQYNFEHKEPENLNSRKIVYEKQRFSTA